MSALVMIHGWGTNAAALATLADELRGRHTVCVPDLPGYGAAPADAHTLDALAGRLAERAPRRCHVLGWSLGAHVALAWARLRPQQVERLALVAATPCFVRRAGWACAMEDEAFEAFADALAADPCGTLARFNALQAHGDVFARRVRERLREIAASSPLPDERALRSGLEILRDTDVRRDLARIEVPALVIHGARDRVVPVEAGEALTAALPDARLAVLSGAAHAPLISYPRAVARLIGDFLP